MIDEIIKLSELVYYFTPKEIKEELSVYLQSENSQFHDPVPEEPKRHNMMKKLNELMEELEQDDKD